jgi:hypothetical protein
LVAFACLVTAAVAALSLVVDVWLAPDAGKGEACGERRANPKTSE